MLKLFHFSIYIQSSYTCESRQAPCKTTSSTAHLHAIVENEVLHMYVLTVGPTNVLSFRTKLAILTVKAASQRNSALYYY